MQDVFAASALGGAQQSVVELDGLHRQLAQVLDVVTADAEFVQHDAAAETAQLVQPLTDFGLPGAQGRFAHFEGHLFGQQAVTFQ